MMEMNNFLNVLKKKPFDLNLYLNEDHNENLRTYHWKV